MNTCSTPAAKADLKDTCTEYIRELIERHELMFGVIDLPQYENEHT